MPIGVLHHINIKKKHVSLFIVSWNSIQNCAYRPKTANVNYSFSLLIEMSDCFDLLLSVVVVPWRALQQVNSFELVAAFSSSNYYKFAAE